MLKLWAYWIIFFHEIATHICVKDLDYKLKKCFCNGPHKLLSCVLRESQSSHLDKSTQKNMVYHTINFLQIFFGCNVWYKTVIHPLTKRRGCYNLLLPLLPTQ